ncbi:MAG: helix-turn-helix transcriptional regulator [Acidobacteriota bacterium]|nr:helix-turn-helix transcriptional regulator [Acidobacteriota bacterium]
MQISSQLTDEAVLHELVGRLARARLDHNLTQAGLAEQAGVSKRTVERLESGAVATHLSVFVRVCRVLGILDRFEALLPEPVDSPIAQLKLRGKIRRRATSTTAPGGSPSKWHWDDRA